LEALIVVVVVVVVELICGKAVLIKSRVYGWWGIYLCACGYVPTSIYRPGLLKEERDISNTTASLEFRIQGLSRYLECLALTNKPRLDCTGD
jgi:hypothetical protein